MKVCKIKLDKCGNGRRKYIKQNQQHHHQLQPKPSKHTSAKLCFFRENERFGFVCVNSKTQTHIAALMSDMSTPFGHFVDKPDGLGIGDGSATMTNMGHMGGQHQRLESVDAGLAKLAEMRECVDAIAQDGAKFFDKGKC